MVPRFIESPMAEEFASLLFGATGRVVPVNLQIRDPSKIADAAQYALTVAENLRASLQHRGVYLEGKRLLEIGPGSDFGSTLILGEPCTSIAVADRFLARWQDDYHLPLYAEMQRRLGRPSRWLDLVVSRGRYDETLLQIQEPAHALTSLDSGTFDVIISNAVLEHAGELQLAVKEMFRITSPGGVGLHQVDFRNHRNFDLPLEHLLLTPEEFPRLSFALNGEVGCQHRLSELADFFVRAGFRVADISVNSVAPEPYMADFMPRLRRSRSAYRDWSPTELAKICACLFVVRPAR
jgi:hypothetical protein